MKIALLCACCLLGIAGCASNPAGDPTQVRLNDIDTRLGNVERVVSNQSLVDLSRRLDALEAQQREQRGSIEVLQNTNETARKSERDLYTDLNKRMAALETSAGGAGAAAAPTAAATTGAAAAAAASAPVDDQAAYNAAYAKLKAGNYTEAINAFQAFMKQYPDSTLLDNAQYWTGEAYYVTLDYEHAARAFRTVGDRWPTSRKAPDALLKLGYTQIEQKHLTAARATLGEVIERYPGSDAAKLAQDRLKKLPSEGH
jgi:tol-pal system protein YbgF